MAVENLSDLYIESLMTNVGQVTCTGISAATEGKIGHDQFSRLLSSGYFNEQYLWTKAKPVCEEIRSDDSVFIIDESVEAKPYTDESELISWHFDHCLGRAIKGVSFLTGLYYSNEVSVPAGVEFVTKIRDTKEGKPKSEEGKNVLFRKLVGHAFRNLDFKYVLADSWFGNSENMRFINQRQGLFVLAIKSNRKVAQSLEDKQQGRYTSIKDMRLEGRTAVVYFEKLDFPVIVMCQVFKNGDDTATLYLASNDLSLSFDQLTTIYKKRWKVEEYHKSIKSNTSFAKSPTRRKTTQKSHFIASIVAFNKFELLKIRSGKNHFATKNYINIIAARHAKIALRQLLTSTLKNDLTLA
jgi:hypothetical protein